MNRRVNRSKPPPGLWLPKYVPSAFDSLDQPWKPGHLRSAYGAIRCHRFKPKDITDDIFLPKSWDTNSWGPMHPQHGVCQRGHRVLHRRHLMGQTFISE
jgi:hypothetical protein